MTQIQEMFGFLAEAFESPRKFVAFVGLLTGLGMLKKGIAVAQNSLYPHWLTAAWLAGGFVLGSAGALSLYWLRSSESRPKDADTIAMEALARQAEIDQQTHAAAQPPDSHDSQPTQPK